jgi:hypothetical protein
MSCRSYNARGIDTGTSFHAPSAVLIRSRTLGVQERAVHTLTP